MQIYNGTLNNVKLIGYLRETPDVVKTANGHIATVYVWTQGPHVNEDGDFTNKFVEWHRVVAHDAHALLLAKYGRPNMKFYIEGKMHSKQMNYNDAPEMMVTEIIADKFEPITRDAEKEFMH